MNNYCEFASTDISLNKNYKNLIEKQKFKDKIQVTTINIKDNKIAKFFEKDKGFYCTITCPKYNFVTNQSFNFVSELLIKQINKFLEFLNFDTILNPKIFIAGLGNPNITADSLGSLVSNKIISTSFELDNKNISNKFFSNVFSLAPSVASANGVYTSQIIKAICKEFKPNLVVLVDSLSCKNIEAIGNTFQISTSGLAPGCEVGLKQPKINKQFLKVPILTIGCPLVCNLENIIDNTKTNKTLTLKDIDIIVKKCADIIAYSLNKCFHKLKKEEILFLSKG